jgi:hypothetical protein
MSAWTPSEIAALGAVVAAAGQLFAAPWRDLGVLTVCVCGLTTVLARGELDFSEAVGLSLAAGLAALAWARGAAFGVGRPGLDGFALFLAVLCALAPLLIPDHVPPAPREQWVEAMVVALGLTAAAGVPLALERPGPRVPRPRWARRVPIR